MQQFEHGPAEDSWIRNRYSNRAPHAVWCRCGVYAARGIASTGNFFVQTLNRWHNHGDDAMDYLNRRSTTSEMKETDKFSVTSELYGGIGIGFPFES